MKYLNAMLVALLMMAQSAAMAGDSLTVAVAANVKFAFDDLAKSFTADTGIEIKPVFGSSGKIVSQIKEGAPYDVFLSADMAYPERLYQEGQAVAAPRVYAYGKVVLWTLKSGPDFGKGLSALASPDVKRIAVANPKLAPYGAQAIKALEKSGLMAAVQPKLVFAENIAQVVQYVDSGNVDAGLTAKSLVTAPEEIGRGRWLDVPAETYEPIAQGAVILRFGQANHGDAAHRFYDFLFSAKARTILEKFYYGLP